MPTVNINIGKREYQLVCGDGQETSLQALASEVSEKLVMLNKSMPNANDTLLLVMTALMIQDELNEARQKIPSSGQETGKDSGMPEEEVNKAIADAVNAIAEYVENIAERIEKA